MRIVKRLLALLFPPKCVLCRRILAKEELDLCRDCRTNSPEYGKNHRKIRYLKDFTAVWFYEDQVRGSLIRYKFYHARSYAPSYGRLLAMKISQEFTDLPEIITWVPISRLRRLRRGYDQVELLARAVSQELGTECVRTLVKVRHNRPQSGISNAQERQANVLGVYRVTGDVAGKRILLLDDILTTGATAGECGRVLLTAGAKEVYCAAVAAGRNKNK